VTVRCPPGRDPRPRRGFHAGRGAPPSVPRHMKVAHVIHGLEVGGLERLVVELARRSRAFGVEPTLVPFGTDGPVRVWAEAADIAIRPLGEVRGLSVEAVRRLAAAVSEAAVVHAHDLGPWLNAVAARALVPRLRVLATFHQLAPPAGPKRGAARLGARLTTALVACGDEVRAELRSWAPGTTPVVTIGNGVVLGTPATAEERARARRHMGLPEGAVAVGYLGRMHPEKGPDLLVEATVRHLLDLPEAHLVLVGRGPLDGALRSAAAPLGARAHLLGEVVEGARGLLAGLDLYAQPSRREGRSLAMLEAMAAGLPTVAHRLPAVAELHVDGTSAVLVPPGDAGALGGALRALVRDPGRRAALGAAARSRAEAFSLDRMVEAYVRLWRAAVPVQA